MFWERVLGLKLEFSSARTFLSQSDHVQDRRNRVRPGSDSHVRDRHSFKQENWVCATQFVATVVTSVWSSVLQKTSLEVHETSFVRRCRNSRCVCDERPGVVT